MQNSKFITKFIIALLGIGIACATGCGVSVSYSFTGGSIPDDVKTFSVAYFPNNAAMVSPTLSPTFTDALVDMFKQRTRLQQVDDGGDFSFEGEITNYSSVPTSISGDEQIAQNRLTITVSVRFTNRVDDTKSWTSPRSFSNYEDYDAGQALASVEGSLIPDIVDKIVTDIYMASAADW